MPTLKPFLKLPLLIVGAMMAPALAPGAEITAFSTPNGEVVTPNADLEATCWQDGSKIFERQSLSGIDLGSALREQTLGLKRQGKTGTDTFVVPLGRTVCIVTATE